MYGDVRPSIPLVFAGNLFLRPNRCIRLSLADRPPVQVATHGTEASEPNRVKPIQVSRLPQNQARRTQHSYLERFQRLNRENWPLLEEMYVSPGAPKPAKPFNLSQTKSVAYHRNGSRQSHLDYLSCFQSLSREKGPFPEQTNRPSYCSLSGGSCPPELCGGLRSARHGERSQKCRPNGPDQR